MSIEVALLISCLSVAFSIFFGLKNSKRSDTKDIEERTKERTELNVKLDYISSNMQEIKNQISSLVEKVDSHGERLTRIESSLGTAWKRIDEIMERLNKEDN